MGAAGYLCFIRCFSCLGVKFFKMAVKSRILIPNSTTYILFSPHIFKICQQWHVYSAKILLFGNEMRPLCRNRVKIVRI